MESTNTFPPAETFNHKYNSGQDKHSWDTGVTLFVQSEGVLGVGGIALTNNLKWVRITDYGEELARVAYDDQTSTPRYVRPASAKGTYLSPISTSRMLLSMCDRRPGSRWHGVQRWTTVPSMPFSGTQPPQPLLPPPMRHSSFGHCTSMRRPRLMLSNIIDGSDTWREE